MDVNLRSSQQAVLRCLHGFKYYSAKLLDLQDAPLTDRYRMAEILEDARHFVSPGSTIFFVSDLQDLNDACEQHLFALARQGNLNLCHVFDNIEQHLPPPSLYAVSDGAQHTLLDTSHANLRERFKQAFEHRTLRLRKISEKLSAGLLPFNTDDTVMSTLRRAYGKKRNSRRGN